MYRVEHNGNGDWLTAVREDLYDLQPDGTFNNDVLTQLAEFKTREEAEQFAHFLRGVMHCGGPDVDIRIVPVPV